MKRHEKYISWTVPEFLVGARRDVTVYRGLHGGRYARGSRTTRGSR
jgi:hypothetical protein